MDIISNNPRSAFYGVERKPDPSIYSIAASAPKSTDFDIEDYIVWPDDDYCLACELSGYSHKSDDYIRVSYSTTEWARIHSILEYY